jgi:hypothetical protein
MPSRFLVLTNLELSMVFLDIFSPKYLYKI